MTRGYNSIQSTCFYLDWGKTWAGYYTMPTYRRSCGQLNPERLLGGEMCVWSEKTTAEKLLCRTFPRGAAGAERFWSVPTTQDRSMDDAKRAFARLQ